MSKALNPVDPPLPAAALPSDPNAFAKQPRLVLEGIFAFPPNRDTLGGTAYLMLAHALGLETSGKTLGNILIDCPAWTEANQQFLTRQGGVSILFLTHRGGMGQVRSLQEAFGCEVILQEQEAYLLPGVTTHPFEKEIYLTPTLYGLWTCGHSPGSACLYGAIQGGILFSGRHLLPTPEGQLAPIRTPKTFHWPRQLRHVEMLVERFSPTTLRYICPGGNIGFLRGALCLDRGYDRLVQGLESLPAQGFTD